MNNKTLSDIYNGVLSNDPNITDEELRIYIKIQHSLQNKMKEIFLDLAKSAERGGPHYEIHACIGYFHFAQNKISEISNEWPIEKCLELDKII